MDTWSAQYRITIVQGSGGHHSEHLPHNDKEKKGEKLKDNSNKLYPLQSRFRHLDGRSKRDEAEYCLREISDMYWKMQNDVKLVGSNMGKDDRLMENDNKNRRAIETIVKNMNILKKLSRGKLSETDQKAQEIEMNSEKETSWKVNELYILTLDNLVFVFHPFSHTKFSAVNTKFHHRGLTVHTEEIAPDFDTIKPFIAKLLTVGYHDNSFIPDHKNPFLLKRKQHMTAMEHTGL